MSADNPQHHRIELPDPNWLHDEKAHNATYDKLLDKVTATIAEQGFDFSAEPMAQSVLDAIWPEILQMMTDQLKGVQEAYETRIGVEDVD